MSVNEAPAAASNGSMDLTLSRLETLLMRAFDGEADEGERAELLAWADAEPRLAELAELRAALREALAVPGPCDVAGDVMALLEEDAAWAPLGDALRDALAPPPALDFAGDVLAALAPSRAPAAPVVVDDPDLELSAFFDGALEGERKTAVAARLKTDAGARATLQAFADQGHLLREAVAKDVDVWPAVARGIGTEPDHVAGWEPIAAQIREAFASIPQIDVAGAVQAAIEPRLARMPRWASLWVPLAGFAAAAALLFAVMPTPRGGGGLVSELGAFALSARNDAEVEQIEAAEDVVVQVMQFEDGGPTFILVDETPGAEL